MTYTVPVPSHSPPSHSEVSTSFRFLYYRSAQIPFPTLQHRSFYIFFFIPWRQRDCSFLAFDVDVISPGLYSLQCATLTLPPTFFHIHPPPFIPTLYLHTTPSVSVFDWTRPFYEFTITDFFLLHLLFFLAKKILRRENLEADRQEVEASLVYSLRGWDGEGPGEGGWWRGRGRASGRSSRIQLSCGKEFWWEEDLGAGRRWDEENQSGCGLLYTHT